MGVVTRASAKTPVQAYAQAIVARIRAALVVVVPPEISAVTMSVSGASMARRTRVLAMRVCSVRLVHKQGHVRMTTGAVGEYVRLQVHGFMGMGASIALTIRITTESFAYRSQGMGPIMIPRSR